MMLGSLSVIFTLTPFVMEIFELSLKLVEEFDGQNYDVYTSDDFTRKSIPVMEAMASQKQGKKLFLGVVSNSLVGVANKMSFFWWTPTRCWIITGEKSCKGEKTTNYFLHYKVLQSSFRHLQRHCDHTIDTTPSTAVA